MKKHSKSFKIWSFFLSLMFMFVGARTDVYAAAVNVTTTYTCPRALCSKKLIIDGPYGNSTDVINTSVPYLGGKTYADAFALHLEDKNKIKLYHLYIIYCPKYDNSDGSVLRHTMTMMFAHHGYTITGYSQYNSVSHYTNKICNHSTDFRGSHLYSLSQQLCGENSMIDSEVLESLAEEYQVNTGCGLSYSDIEEHSWTYGNWASTGIYYHERSKTCSLCGYASIERRTHSFIISDYKSVDSTKHSYTKTCSVCGYSEKVNEVHSFTNGDWTAVDSLTHKRNVTCSKCLYNKNETENHRDDNGDLICDDCNYVMPVFSVTVPTSMNLTMSKDGTVYAANNVKIDNNSSAAVKVSSVEITGKNGWTVVPYSTNMANEKVDCKKVGFRLNNISTKGSGQLELDNNWTIAANSSLSLNYNAVISATSSPIVNENILDVKYIIEWSD